MLIKPSQIGRPFLHQVFDCVVCFALELLVLIVSRNGPENAKRKTRRDLVEFYISKRPLAFDRANTNPHDGQLSAFSETAAEDSLHLMRAITWS